MLVMDPIDDECRQQITSVSPRIKLTDVSDLFGAEQSGELASKEKLDVLLAEAEVIFGRRLPRNIITRAPRLKWGQTVAAGVDMFLDTEMLEGPVILTNASGIHATPIGEFILGSALMFARRAPLYFQLKQEKQWRRFPPSVLRLKNDGDSGVGEYWARGGTLS